MATFVAARCAPPAPRYARKHFPSTRYLDYAITVENYTLQKVGHFSSSKLCKRWVPVQNYTLQKVQFST